MTAGISHTAHGLSNLGKQRGRGVGARGLRSRGATLAGVCNRISTNRPKPIAGILDISLYRDDIGKLRVETAAPKSPSAWKRHIILVDDIFGTVRSPQHRWIWDVPTGWNC